MTQKNTASGIRRPRTKHWKRWGPTSASAPGHGPAKTTVRTELPGRACLTITPARMLSLERRRPGRNQRPPADGLFALALWNERDPILRSGYSV